MLEIKTPPLRVREGDIELLAYYFFNKIAEKGFYKAKGFNPDALLLINHYQWPGNVRQLMNCIRHAVVVSDNNLLSLADLGLERRYKDRVLQTLVEARAISDQELIQNSLRHTSNNISHTAKTLGISRVSLYRLMNKYNMVNQEV